MNRYYELIKNNIIDFDKLMIDLYTKLCLNEIDAIILIKLNNLLKKGIVQLSTSLIIPYMSITDEACSKRIVDLVNTGFITLELSSIDAKETFSLDATYQKLSFILEKEEDDKEEDIAENEMMQIVRELEKGMGRILSAVELEMVTRWFVDYDFSFAEMEETVMTAMKNKTHGVKYIDRLFHNKQKNKHTSITPKSDIKELFDKVYVKSR